MLWLILITALITYCAFVMWQRRKLPPGPIGLPIVGYLPWINPKTPYETLTELSKKYGPVYGLYLGSVYTVVLTDPKDIRTVFSKDAFSGRAPLYVTHGIMKGYGIICTEGDLWKDQRKFIYSCLRHFGANKISPRRDKLESIITREVSDLIQCISEMKESVTFDPVDVLRHSVGSVMNRLTFGKVWSRDDATWKWLQDLQEEGTKHIGVAGPLNFLPFLRFVPKLKSTMNFLMEGKIETHMLYQELIEEKQDDAEAIENCENLIAAFLRERQRRSGTSDVEKFYNDQQFYHILADFFGAGLDTTLTTIRWYLLYMAANPHVQSKVQQEIDAVTQGNPISLEQMSSLPLTEASLYEAQRIRSVVPVGIPHGTITETHVRDYKIPAHTMIVPLQWAIHMNSAFWKEPEKFDPFRFIDEEGRLVKPDYFIPFQTGKRMCVGEDLARMLLFLFGASIIQKFTLSINENYDLTGECGITLTPKNQDISFKVRH